MARKHRAIGYLCDEDKEFLNKHFTKIRKKDIFGENIMHMWYIVNPPFPVMAVMYTKWFEWWIGVERPGLCYCRPDGTGFAYEVEVKDGSTVKAKFMQLVKSKIESLERDFLSFKDAYESKFGEYK